jgi:hypothetical protein
MKTTTGVMMLLVLAATLAAGVAVFVQTQGGLMADASVGGQKFKFEPKP